MSAGAREITAAIQADRLRQAERARLASTLASHRRSRRSRRSRQVGLPLRSLLARRRGAGRAAAGRSPVSSAVCPAPRL
jgi:hypothetical protein